MTMLATQPVTSRDAGKARLLSRLRNLAMINGQEMQLASGRTSDIYFDMKMPMFDPETINLIADEVLRRVRDERAQLIGGLELGAVPIIAAVVCKSYPEHPVYGFFVRKTVKEHGTRKKIEGHFNKGQRIVLLDDVTTTGGSVLEAVREVRIMGGYVNTVLTIVDREEGARENLEREGIALSALFTKVDFRS